MGSSKNSYIKYTGAVPLSSLGPGEGGVISSLRLGDSFPEERLRAFGLVPGAPVVIERTFPVLALRLQFSNLFLDNELAEKIFVFPKPTKKPK